MCIRVWVLFCSPRANASGCLVSVACRRTSCSVWLKSPHRPALLVSESELVAPSCPSQKACGSALFSASDFLQTPGFPGALHWPILFVFGLSSIYIFRSYTESLEKWRGDKVYYLENPSQIEVQLHAWNESAKILKRRRRRHWDLFVTAVLVCHVAEVRSTVAYWGWAHW